MATHTNSRVYKNPTFVLTTEENEPLLSSLESSDDEAKQRWHVSTATTEAIWNDNDTEESQLISLDEIKRSRETSDRRRTDKTSFITTDRVIFPRRKRYKRGRKLPHRQQLSSNTETGSNIKIAFGLRKKLLWPILGFCILLTLVTLIIVVLLAVGVIGRNERQSYPLCSVGRHSTSSLTSIGQTFCNDLNKELQRIWVELNKTKEELRLANIKISRFTTVFYNISKKLGPMGPRGFNGSDGGMGPPGLRGPPGQKGPAGYNGTDGRNGLRGYNGSDGETGPRGLRGLMGPPGYNGSDGSRGPPGYNGTNGKTSSSDFSQCRHGQRIDQFSKVSLPADSLGNRVVTGVTCSCDDKKATTQLEFLKYRSLYICTCNKATTSGRQYCRIHYWTCPRT